MFILTSLLPRKKRDNFAILPFCHNFDPSSTLSTQLYHFRSIFLELLVADTFKFPKSVGTTKLLTIDSLRNVIEEGRGKSFVSQVSNLFGIIIIVCAVLVSFVLTNRMDKVEV